MKLLRQRNYCIYTRSVYDLHVHVFVQCIYSRLPFLIEVCLLMQSRMYIVVYIYLYMLHIVTNSIKGL